mmetsp:Transcript_10070/g.18319  ORF Transcript_10070/g.18319 Transcript_10070/m.18319 type:complete len:143 (-) Transcript_10070:241-669(-)
MSDFLDGAQDMDQHYSKHPFAKTFPSSCRCLLVVHRRVTKDSLVLRKHVIDNIIIRGNYYLKIGYESMFTSACHVHRVSPSSCGGFGKKGICTGKEQIIGENLLDYDVHATFYFSKDDMRAIEPTRLGCREEELGPIGIFSG